MWSRINKEHVEAVVAVGRMTLAGWEKIEAAKWDGSWSILDDVEAGVVPDDLAAAFDAEPGARENFDAFTLSQRCTWRQKTCAPTTRGCASAGSGTLPRRWGDPEPRASVSRFQRVRNNSRVCPVRGVSPHIGPTWTSGRDFCDDGVRVPVLSKRAALCLSDVIFDTDSIGRDSAARWLHLARGFWPRRVPEDVLEGLTCEGSPRGRELGIVIAPH